MKKLNPVTLPVKILRDSGAMNSFIVDSVLPLSPETDTSSSVDVQGMGLTVFSAPQHKLRLASDLVQSDVAMECGLPSLWGGVHIILGNDLASDRVWPRVATPMDPPIFQVESSLPKLLLWYCLPVQ